MRGPPSLLCNGYRVFPGGKGGRGVALTISPHLVPRSTGRSRATPLLSLRAFAAYNRVKPYLTRLETKRILMFCCFGVYRFLRICVNICKAMICFEVYRILRIRGNICNAVICFEVYRILRIRGNICNAVI